VREGFHQPSKPDHRMVTASPDLDSVAGERSRRTVAAGESSSVSTRMRARVSDSDEPCRASTCVDATEERTTVGIPARFGAVRVLAANASLDRATKRIARSRAGVIPAIYEEEGHPCSNQVYEQWRRGGFGLARN